MAKFLTLHWWAALWVNIRYGCLPKCLNIYYYPTYVSKNITKGVCLKHLNLYTLHVGTVEPFKWWEKVCSEEKFGPNRSEEMRFFLQILIKTC